MRFYLGAHQPHWLASAGVPLFVSHMRLQHRRTFPRASTAWALDSGGFTQLSMHGNWTVSPAEYIAAIRRYQQEIGLLDWAAIQDWMCEPFIIAKTGLSVTEHQARTVASYLDLRERAPELPWAPVLQGWTAADYLYCVDAYERAGVDLRALPVVGVGSVCRRQGGAEAAAIVRLLAGLGLKLHGFGFKLTGLAEVAGELVSADSMAWSFDARRRLPLPGCTHKNCANCARFALRWYAQVQATIERNQRVPQQLMLAVA